MAEYCVNTKLRRGDHEVHTLKCRELPEPEYRHYLGEFTSCREAVAAAQKIFTPVNGCYWCSTDCHTR